MTLSTKEQAQEFMHRQDWAHALPLWQALAGEKSDNIDILLPLAQCHIQMGQLDDAKAVYQKGLSLNPEDKNTLLGLIRIAQIELDWAKADELWQKLNINTTDDTSLITSHIRYLLSKDEPEEAQKLFKERIVDKESLPGQLLAIDIEQALQNWDGVSKIFDNLEKEFGTSNKQILRRKSMYLSAMREHGEALKCYQLTVDENALSAPERADLARLYAAVEDTQTALSLVDGMDEAWAGHGMTSNLKTWAHIYRGNGEQARAAWAQNPFRPNLQLNQAMSVPVSLVHWPSTVSETGRLRLYTQLRNERVRLPGFLEHYRKMGITQFFMVDNGSTDGSREYLLKQPDVVTFETPNSFSKAKFGTYWVNWLLDNYPPESWALYVDLDEHLILPAIEERGLFPLLDALEARGDEAVMAPMLDMFPETIEQGRAFKEGDALLEACPYFDPDLAFHNTVLCPFVLTTGGASQRLFFGAPSANLTKVPLIRADKGIRFMVISHVITPAKISSIRGALLHFKFVGPFLDRVREEAERKEHWRGARQYSAYHETFESMEDTESLLGPSSVLYEGAAQLESLGLIKTLSEETGTHSSEALKEEAKKAERLHDWQSALSYWQKLLGLEPDSLDVQINIGKAHFQLGHLDSAEQLFERLLCAEPNNIEVLQECARLAEHNTDWEKAERLQAHLLEVAPDNRAVRHAHIRYLTARNRFDEALKQFDEFCANDESIDAALLLLSIHLAREDNATVFALLDVLEKTFGVDTPRLVRAKSDALAADKQFGAAIEHLLKNQESASMGPLLKAHLAILYIKNNQEKEAETLIEELADDRQFERSVANCKAWLLAKNGDGAGAREAWHKAQFRPRLQFTPAMRHAVNPIRIPYALNLSAPLRLFTHLKNESLRLPAFLEHYRKLGVGAFFIIDNGSTDGSRDFLLEQADVALFHTEASFLKAQFGSYWINDLISLYGDKCWSLYVDLDEFIVLPELEGPSALPLLSKLDARGDEAVQAFMLDMIPETMRQGEAYQAGDNPNEISPFFDNNYRAVGDIQCPYKEVKGGVGDRLFAKAPNPNLTKTPLIRADKGVRFISSTHWITPAKVSTATAALLHHKFIGPFRDKIRADIRASAQWTYNRGFSEYIDGFSALGLDDNLIGSDTFRYESAKQLEELGLIKGL